MIALRISGAMGICELGVYIILRICVFLLSGSLPYTGLDPLLTVGVLAVMGFATATSDGYDIAKSKIKENKSQWIFFPTRKKTISPGVECCNRQQELQEPKPAQGNSKTSTAKIERLLLWSAVVVFALCTVLVASGAAIGSFVVLMPIAGICLFGGVILRVIDYLRKH